MEQERGVGSTYGRQHTVCGTTLCGLGFLRGLILAKRLVLGRPRASWTRGCGAFLTSTTIRYYYLTKTLVPLVELSSIGDMRRRFWPAPVHLPE